MKDKKCPPRDQAYIKYFHDENVSKSCPLPSKLPVEKPIIINSTKKKKTLIEPKFISLINIL